MRIHTGPGYRVYFTRQEKVVYVILLGGDKSTGWAVWYRQAIPLAEELYRKYLKDRAEEEPE